MEGLQKCCVNSITVIEAKGQKAKKGKKFYAQTHNTDAQTHNTALERLLIIYRHPSQKRRERALQDWAIGGSGAVGSVPHGDHTHRHARMCTILQGWPAYLVGKNVEHRFASFDAKFDQLH